MKWTNKEREYSVRRWAWVFITDMVMLGAVIGGAAGVFIYWRFFRQSGEPDIFILFPILVGGAVGGWIFGSLGERWSRKSRQWKTEEDK